VGVEDGGRVEVVEREVPVGHRVDRVPHLTRRRGQAERRARERSGAERALGRRRGGGCEARPVAVEHLHPREQVMAEGDRLAPLEVRIARERGVGLGLGKERTTSARASISARASAQASSA
jgi:hypothetical protein